MTVRFPDEPGFQGRFAPVRLEGEIRGVEVTQGEIPASLHGTFYRVGADPAWPPLAERDFYFNADGMVAMFRFENGFCDFRSRYVRTPRFAAERAARRSLFGAYRNPFTDDPSVAGLSRGLANTNVYWHGGRLLASKEDSAPIQLDPDTLDTVGEFTWDGDLSSRTATAHPKIDPRDGSLVFFGYMARGETTPDIAYYEADASGKIVHEAWFEAPYSSMVHDWAVTENFVIFPIIPLTASLDRLKAGGPIYVWDGSQDVYLGVVLAARVDRALVPRRQPVRLAHHERLRRRAVHPHRHAGRREVGVPLVPRHHRGAVRPGEDQRVPVAVDDRHAGAAGSRRRGDRVRPGAADRLLGRVPPHGRPVGGAGLPVRGDEPDVGAGRAARRRAARVPLAGVDRPGFRGDADAVRRARLDGAGGDLRAAARFRQRRTARGT